MKVVRYVRPLQAEIVDIPSTPLPPEYVRVRVERVAICGSDVRRFQDLVRPGVWPLTPGHELAGTVVETGPGATAAVGQRAAIFPVTSCGQCRACQRERPNLCAEMRIMGPSLPGGYAEEVVIHQSMLRPIPDNLSFDDAALAEPLAVAIHGANRARIEDGDRVAILGAGAIGLLQQQVVKAKGAGYVLITGRTEKKLAYARELGADEAVNVTQETLVTPERANSFDVVIDLVCNQSTIDQGLALASIGGRLVYIAGPDAGQPAIVDMHSPEWRSKELSIMKSKIYDTDFDEAIPLMASGQVKAAAIITHRFPLADAHRALHAVIANRQEVVKAMLEP